MIEMLRTLDFILLKDFLKLLNIDLTNSLTQNTYIKHPPLRKFSHTNFLTLGDIIKQAIQVCLNKSIPNVITNGYKQQGSKILLYSPNPSLNELNTAEFNNLLSIVGDDIFLFILIECTLIKHSCNNFLILTGNLKMENKKYKCINRRNLFYKNDVRISLEEEDIVRYITSNMRVKEQNNLQLKDKQYTRVSHFFDYLEGFDIKSHINGQEDIHNIEFLNIDLLQNANKKYKRLKMPKLFHSYFKENLSCQLSYLERFLPPKKLINFLFCISRKIFTNIFSKYNFRILKQKLTLFIYRNKYETLSEEELIRYFKINEFNLLNYKDNKLEDKRKEYIIRSEIVKYYLIYLFDCFYIPLINQYVYCTETCTTKNKVYYFPRCEWYKYTESFMNEYLSDKRKEIQKSNKKDKYIGKVRVIPKILPEKIEGNNEPERNIDNMFEASFTNVKGKHDNNIKLTLSDTYTPDITDNLEEESINLKDVKTGRLITNLNTKSNKMALDIYQVLKKEYRNKLGNSVLGYEDMSPFIYPYINQENVYILKLDVKKCFENINHKYMNKILKRMKIDTNYIVHAFSEILFRRDHIVASRKKTTGDYTIQYKRYYDISDDYKPFKEFLSNFKDKIIRDEYYREYDKQEIVSKIQEILLNNKIYYKGNEIYLKDGIPQGSILSTIMCSIYYDYIDKKYFNNIIKKGRLIRYVDDFLIMTTDTKEIQGILEISNKLRKYGVSFNLGKAQCNFIYKDGDIRIYENEITYCGLRFITSFRKVTEINKMTSIGREFDIKDSLREEYKKSGNFLKGLSNRNLPFRVSLKCSIKDPYIKFGISYSSKGIGSNIMNSMIRFIRCRSTLLVNRNNPKVYENIFDIFVMFNWKLTILFSRAIFVNKNYYDEVIKRGALEMYEICKRRKVNINYDKLLNIMRSVVEEYK